MQYPIHTLHKGITTNRKAGLKKLKKISGTTTEWTDQSVKHNHFFSFKERKCGRSNKTLSFGYPIIKKITTVDIPFCISSLDLCKFVITNYIIHHLKFVKTICNMMLCFEIPLAQDIDFRHATSPESLQQSFCVNWSPTYPCKLCTGPLCQ